MWQEDEEEDVRSYWMTLRTGEDTLIWKRRLWIALCGGIILEEALDLSSNSILNNNLHTHHLKLEGKCTIAWYKTYNVRSIFPRTNDITHPVLPSSLRFYTWKWKEEIWKAVWTNVSSCLYKCSVTLLTVVSLSFVYCCFSFWNVPQTV